MSDEQRRPSSEPQTTAVERLLRERRLLAAARRSLRERFDADADGFVAAWRAFAHARAGGRAYRELNELIAEHNEWYPVERDLPVHPRTGEWVTALGRSHERPLLSADGC